MAILAALWVVLTYFIADYLGAPTHTALLISALTLIWALVFFILWQRNITPDLAGVSRPFGGLLVAVSRLVCRERYFGARCQQRNHCDCQAVVCHLDI